LIGIGLLGGAPWSIVRDANGQSLAYVYSRENPSNAHMAKECASDCVQHREASQPRRLKYVTV
jgi:hypothetical protein